jgi:hypothetical protein
VTEKFPRVLPGYELETSRLVAQYLNQLHRFSPHPPKKSRHYKFTNEISDIVKEINTSLKFI